MSKTTTMGVEIRFGDCDPAGIVFFPRYHRWMDAASLHFFMSCGVPPWHELELTTGIIGTPLLEHHARFVKSATYGEKLTITTYGVPAYTPEQAANDSAAILAYEPEVYSQLIITPQSPLVG